MCRKLKSMVQDAMAVKDGCIQGRLHQTASLPWPLLELKLKTSEGEVVHVNESLSREFDKDTSFLSSPKEGDPLNLLDVPNNQQDNGRRQDGDVSLFTGGAADESHGERIVSSPVRYVLKVHFFIESGRKMIQFKIQFKTKSKIFIQKIFIQLSKGNSI